MAPADWAGQGGTYGGLANPAKEKYVDGANAPIKAGEVMTQTIDGLLLVHTLLVVVSSVLPATDLLLHLQIIKKKTFLSLIEDGLPKASKISTH